MGKSKAYLIAQDVAFKIKHGQFKVGEFLPSENELSTLYGSARETVRKALNQLNSLGLIQKIKGKGSLVLNLERFSFPISGISSFAELNTSLAMKAKTKVLVLKRMADLPNLFKEKFPEQNKQSGIYVERLRLINNTPEILDCDFLFSLPVNDLSEKVASASIYDYLENDLGLKISYATKVITVEKITPDFQKNYN